MYVLNGNQCTDPAQTVSSNLIWYHLCLPGDFHAFLSSADFSLKTSFSKISFRNTVRVSKNLDPDQAQHLLGLFA